MCKSELCLKKKQRQIRYLHFYCIFVGRDNQRLVRHSKGHQIIIVTHPQLVLNRETLIIHNRLELVTIRYSFQLLASAIW